jgi:transcriptional regulator with XRE-family HTH domain
MGGRRSSRQELAQLEALTREGLTTREVAEKLGRSPAAIRNLRYKKHLTARTQDEIKVLRKEREELISAKNTLQGEIGKLEASLIECRGRVRQALAEDLIKLKAERPDLFSMFLLPQEQINKLVDTLMGKKR